jgi:hypothetical protein
MRRVFAAHPGQLIHIDQAIQGGDRRVSDV